MESDNSFGMYLHTRGFDMIEVHREYMAMMSQKPEFILHYYERKYPDEWVAWKAKQRVMGDAEN